MSKKRFSALILLSALAWAVAMPICPALSLYSDWKETRGDARTYPKKDADSRLKFLGIEFGKTLEEQNIRILGVHELGVSDEYPDLAVRGHRELYEYSEFFPAVEIAVPKVFRKFKRGWAFLSPVGRRVVAIHFATEGDDELSRQQANCEIFRSFSLIADSFPEFGFDERELGMPPLGMMLGGSDYICVRASTRRGLPEWDFTLTCWNGGYQVGLHVIDIPQWIKARKEMQEMLDRRMEQEEPTLNNTLR